MIVDSSVVVAALSFEPGADVYAKAVLRASSVRMSAATYLETSLVIDGRKDPVLSRALDEFLAQGEITVEPVTFEQVKIARQAHRDFGRGSGHPAKLNFGDCFSYALASVTGEPLLYKGDDFVHTDLRSALDG